MKTKEQYIKENKAYKEALREIYNITGLLDYREPFTNRCELKCHHCIALLIKKVYSIYNIAFMCG